MLAESSLASSLTGSPHITTNINHSHYHPQVSKSGSELNSLRHGPQLCVCHQQRLLTRPVRASCLLGHLRLHLRLLHLQRDGGPLPHHGLQDHPHHPPRLGPAHCRSILLSWAHIGGCSLRPDQLTQVCVSQLCISTKFNLPTTRLGFLSCGGMATLGALLLLALPTMQKPSN